MDSNAGFEERPNVGENADGTNQITTVPGDASQTTGQMPSRDQSTDQKQKTEESSDGNGFQSNTGYIHPLDVPERDDVIGKTVIVAGNAVVLSNNREESVYGMPGGVQTETEVEAQSETVENETQSVSAEQDETSAE